MKHNIIKRTLTIIALALSVVTNAVADAYTMPKLADNGKTIDIYLNLDGTETSPLSITDITADRILSDLGSGATTPLEDNIYLRWYTLSSYNASTGSGTVLNSYNDGWKFQFSDGSTYRPCGSTDGGWGNYSDYIFRWFSSKPSQWDNNNTNLPKALKLTVKFNNTLQENYKNVVICEVANKAVSSTDVSSDKYTKEDTESSFFQLRYVIHFDKDPNGFVGNLKDNGKEVSLSVKTEKNEGAITSYSYDETSKISTANISLSKDANALSGGVTYARWYVANTAGKELSAEISGNTIKTTTGVTVTLPLKVTYQTPAKDATNSQYWFSKDAKTDAIDGITVSGNYAALSSCQLVCVMSNDAPGSDNFKLSDDSKTVTQEPDWDLKYVIDFSSLPFVQPTLTSDGKTIDVYLELSDTQTSPLQFSSVLSNSEYTKNKVQSAASGLISNLDQSYVRLYMLDKNNSIVPLSLQSNGVTPSSGWAISFSYNSFQPLGSGASSNEAYSDNIYRYYYNKQKDQWNKMTSIPQEVFLEGNVNLAFASGITPSKSGNTIVIEFAENTTDNEISDYKGAKDAADGFYKLRYVLHFNEEFPATNIDDESSYTTKEASIVLNADKYADVSKPFKVISNEGSSTNIKSIAIDLSAVDEATTLGINNGVKYARWYFVDSNGDAVAAPNGLNIEFGDNKEAGNTVKDKNNTDKTQMGKYYYSSNLSTTPINIIIENGNFSNLKNYKLVCAMSTDDATAVKNASDETKLTHEPNWSIKYVISFVPTYTKPSVTTEKHVYLSVEKDKTEGTLDIATLGATDGFTLDGILSELTTINGGTAVTSSSLLSNGYVRWYMLDKYELVTPIMDASTDNWGLNFGGTGVYPLGFGSEGNEAYDDNILRWYKSKDASLSIEKVFSPTLTFKGVEPAESGSVLICEITNTIGNNGINSSAYKANNEENVLKLRYAFHFNDFIATNAESTDYKEAKLIAILNANANNKATTYESGKVTINLDKSNKASSLGIDKGVKYARWYFVDDNGMNIATPTGVTLKVNGSKTVPDITRYGQYVYTTEVSTSGINGITIEGTNDVLKNCNLVCVMSTTDESATVVDNSEVTHEPDWDVKYLISFVEDADGFLATNRTDASSYTSKSTVVSLGKDTDAFKYSESDGTGTLTINLSKDKNVQDAELSSGVKYIRWFFLDADGNIATNTGLTVSAANGITLTQKDNYGYYWYAGSNGSATSAMDGITISGSKENLLKYTLACVMSNDDSNANVSSGTLLHEPDWSMYYKMSLLEHVELKHYKGYTYTYGKYKDGKINLEDGDTWTAPTPGKYQEVHEWEYDIYVRPGESVNLELPIQNYQNNSTPGGNYLDAPLEPWGYYRWYDYETDAISSYLELNTTYPTDNTYKYTLKKNSNGYMQWHMLACPSMNVTTIKFNAPSTNWDGSVIACDVSRYTDFEESESNGQLLREPTLSIRYIFRVHKAEDIANALKDAIINSNGTSTLEDAGYTSIGVKDEKSYANLRLNLQDDDLYYFYAYNYANKSVPDNADLKNAFGTELLQAKHIKWYAYDISGKYYKEITNGFGYVSINGYRMAQISLENVRGTYSALEGSGTKTYNEENLNVNDIVYIAAYAAESNATDARMCPVARFTVRFLPYYMLKKGADNFPVERTISWMDANYEKKVAHITFDTDTQDASDDAPTNCIDNKTHTPSTWSRRHYGYSYSGLYDYLDNPTQGQYTGGLACKHGDYGLFKSANVSGISTINVDYNGKNYVYGWYEGSQLRDQTYTLTEGRKSGYFLYVDANEESRPIASIDFDGDLCSGSTFVMSAAIACMSSEAIKPQLIFKLYGASKDDVTGEVTKGNLIHSFATCPMDKSTNELKNFTWYQVYGKVTLQANTGVENYEHFLVEVDNYGEATFGNDIAIDDIRFYTRNANILVTQDAPVCEGDANGTVTFKIPHESLVAKLGVISQWATKQIRWKIVDSKGNDVEAYYDGKTKTKYSEVTFYRNSSNIKGSLISENIVIYKTDENGQEVKDENGNKVIDEDATKTEQDRHYPTINGELYFMLAQGLKLPANDTYYISVSLDGGKTWGNPDETCSVHSNRFTLGGNSYEITNSEGTINPDIIVDCNTHQTIADQPFSAQLNVPDPINGGEVTLDDVLLDWFIGSKAEYNSESNSDLAKALTAFRSVEAYKTVTVSVNNNTVSVKDATGKDITVSTDDTNFTSAQWTLLQTAAKEGKLYLGYSTITPSITNEGVKQSIYLLPLIDNVDIIASDGTKTNVAVCTDPFEIILNVRTNGPLLYLGFKDVPYPSISDNRSVRLGLKQHLTPMQNDGTLLRLPINDYQLKSGSTSSTLKTGETFSLAINESNNKVVVSETNDPTWPSTGTTAEVGTVTKLDKNFVYIKFNKSISYDFHEGYWYELNFSFYDTKDDNQAGPCYGDVFFDLKVVPEYTTWTGKADIYNGSTNWNNDENWTRSLTTEIYKNATDYSDYEKVETAGKLSQQKTYVPMKFTKVTVPMMSNFRYAYLAKMEKKSNGILKDECLTNADSYAATDDIQYDLMVMMNTGTKDDNGTGDEAFGCEKFYGNTCEQIYFKPEAELRQQQYLTYEKAWVEKEIASNKWYTLATPLQDTYAGDMYVPYDIKDVTVGRQETEAFAEIKFSTPSYSRNNAPIYQRSWDRADSKMLMNDSGTLEDGDADIKYTDWESTSETTANLIKSNWSHVYNDMNVKYYDAEASTPRYGFAIKVGNDEKSVTTGTTKAMIRLPKADTKYYYYYANDQVSSKNSGDLTKTSYGKLLMDKDNIYKAESNEYGSITQKLVNSSTDKGYANGIYLISNPYMKTLNMVKFFNMNPNLEKKFWIIRDGEVKAANATEVTQKSADGTTATDTYMPAIKPLESFFVKVASGSTATSVTFNTNITTSTEYVYQKFTEATQSSSQSSSAARYKSRSGMSVVPQQELTMTATSSAGRSTANVVVREDADDDFVESEDVETLFDSNLADLPTLYTVAGSEAVSINTLSDIDVLPIGIVSSVDGNVDVTINGASSIDQPLWLFDAKTATMTSLDESTTVNLVSNVHGRYYLTTRSTINNIEENVTEVGEVKAYSPSIHTLVVSALGSTINSVKVFSTDGRVIAEESVNGSSTTMTTISGVNIVKVTTDNGNVETIKVNVR